MINALNIFFIKSKLKFNGKFLEVYNTTNGFRNIE
jgi:hypothetical protein